MVPRILGPTAREASRARRSSWLWDSSRSDCHHGFWFGVDGGVRVARDLAIATVNFVSKQGAVCAKGDCDANHIHIGRLGVARGI